MKGGNSLLVQPWLAMVGITMLFTLAPSSNATTHIIQFGGPIGFEYSPSVLAVTVGDTIEWQGAFSTHPLSSTTIPLGASPWHNGTGTIFQYVVPLPGTYDYQCDNHFAFGMVGSFTAALTGISREQTMGRPVSFRLEQNYPNPFNPSTTITYALPNKAYVSLAVYDVSGRKVAQVVDGLMGAGFQQAVLDGSGLASGTYFYRLQARTEGIGQAPIAAEQAGVFEQSKKLLLLK